MTADRLGTAALAVSPRASSIRWRRWTSQPSATESITNTGSLAGKFRNGYQVELPDAWMQYGTPLEDRAARACFSAIREYARDIWRVEPVRV